uniref:ESX-1 secretion system protein EccCa1 n=1 Tax=Mycobacterium riyadhense TaxID=486698 RepID=A0A653EY86_9MYCO|nr:ESX-1 secretion system protein EccCa1 [Mycobacterium riyadhense]
MSTKRFEPGTRATPPKVDGGKQALPDCPVAPRRLPLTKAQIILPSVMGAAFVGMVAMIVTQPGLRSGPMGFFSLFLPVMMIGSFAGIFLQGRFAGADNKALSPAALDEERREYMNGLDEARDVIHKDAQRQFENFRFFHPEPSLLRGLVGSSRMWEREPGDSGLGLHFGFVRVGTGTSDLAKKLATQSLGRPSDYEPVAYHALQKFVLEQSKVAGIAKPLSLKAIPLMTLVGEDGPETVYGLVRAMICQAACFHSPNDLKIMVVTDDASRWEWVKWLPHCQHSDLVDSGGPARMVWTSPQQMEAAVGVHLHNSRKNFGTSGGIEVPHWLVFNDQRRVDSEWDALNRKGSGGVAGVTFVRVVVQEEQL